MYFPPSKTANSVAGEPPGFSLRLPFDTIQSLWQKLNSTLARPVRFIIVGGSAAIVQLILLRFLVGYRVEGVLADAIAIAISAEINFTLSLFFTWRQSRGWTKAGGGISRTWGKFHLAISLGLLINLGVFTLAGLTLSTTIAGVLGIIVASSFNYFANNKLTFQTITS